ncbi:MAG: hypothetical protein ACK6BM_03170 [Cyanobacteriota bacterium]
MHELANNQKMSIHYRYWLLILILSLIAVVTEKWSQSPNFTTYLSNAATLTSLLLGLVAIFYSFISNDSLSRGLGGISIVSQEISDSKDQIAGYLRDTDDINASIALSRGSIEQARSELAGDLIELKSLLQGVREESRELGSIVSNIPPRRERVETGMEGIFSLLQAPQTESTQRNREDPSKESFEKEFLNRSSLDLNLLIVALCQSASSNKAIKCRNLYGLIPGSRGFILGRLLMLLELGLVSYRFGGTSGQWSDTPIEIASMTPVFRDEAETSYLSRISDASRLKQGDAEKYKKLLDDIHGLFSG